MNIKWLKPKHSVCSECGVHFEPVTGYESRWGHLCATHRKPVKERDMKRDEVIAWASMNWERLTKMMEEDQAKLKADYNKAMKDNYAHSMALGRHNCAGLQQAAMGAFNLGQQGSRG